MADPTSIPDEEMYKYLCCPQCQKRTPIYHTDMAYNGPDLNYARCCVCGWEGQMKDLVFLDGNI